MGLMRKVRVYRGRLYGMWMWRMHCSGCGRRASFFTHHAAVRYAHIHADKHDLREVPC